MAIVWPAFALVALASFSVARLARMRFAAAHAGRVDPRFYKVLQGPVLLAYWITLGAGLVGASG
jgi:hypothetical protein